MANILIPSAQGGRLSVDAPVGASVHSVLIRHKVVGQSARRGVEKKVLDTGSWVPVPLSYIIKENDHLRVRFPAQKPSGQLIGKLLTALFGSTKRRERGSTRNRKRKK